MPLSMPPPLQKLLRKWLVSQDTFATRISAKTRGFQSFAEVRTFAKPRRPNRVVVPLLLAFLLLGHPGSHPPLCHFAFEQLIKSPLAHAAAAEPLVDGREDLTQ